MGRFVIDASVALNWYIPGPDTAEAQALVAPENELFAPDLLRIETANALWKLVRFGGLPESEAAAILRAFRRIPLRIVDSGTVLQAAYTLAVRLQETVYDALYLAVAIQLDAQLVTTDRRLLRAAARGSLGRRVRPLRMAGPGKS